jgi:glycosyltransferase involved in cell wall biosynthesis
VKVTVITAVYNGCESIGASLASVAAQDYGNVEHIVVDGASTDGTLEVVRQAAIPGLRIHSEKDTGVYQAFNRGLRMASGEAIVFLNAGDVYSSSSALSTMMAALMASGRDAVYGDVAITHQPKAQHEVAGRILRRYSSRKFKPSRMSFGLMPAHPTLLLRRGVYERVGPFDERYRIAGDFEFCLRAFLTHQISSEYLPQMLVVMPTGGLSNRGWRSKWEITMEMRRACANNGVPTSIGRLCLRFPWKVVELLPGAIHRH